MNFKLYQIKFRDRVPPSILAMMIGSYTLMIGTWTVNRFMSFNATLWDMGLMIQAIWNTAHGRILHESVNLGFSVSRLAVAHWELIYLPLAVIYRIIPSIPLLLYTQTFILACGIIPIYKFAEKKLSSETTALLIASAYLFYPALHGTNLFDLHGLTFATTFLLFTFYYLDQQNLRKTILFAFFSICCREDVAFIIFMLGLYGWIIKKNSKIGLSLLSLGIVWIIAFFARPYFSGYQELMETTSMAPNWEHLGINHIFEIFNSPVKKITTILEFLCSYENIKYIAKLILPVAGLCCLSPEILVIAAPTLLLNLLSNWHQMHQIEYHYTATITPFIFLAAIKGMTNLTRWLVRFPKFQANQIQFILGSIIVLSAMVSTAQFSILRFHKTWRVSESNRKLLQQLKEIPSELSVSATARAGAHLANREALYHFPERCSDVDIVVIEINRPEVEIKNLAGTLRTRKVPAMNEFAQSIFQDTTLGLKFVQDNVFCFQRGLASRESFARYAFLEVLSSKATERKKIDFGNGLYFWGWEPVYIGDQQAHFHIFWLNNNKQSEQANINFYLKYGISKIAIRYQPLFGRISIHGWPPGKIIGDHLFINRPTGNEINAFSVVVSASDAEKAHEYHLFEFTFP